jgi:hypothetical protein
MHDRSAQHKSTAAESAEVRMVDWVPYGLAAGKRARNRFISVLIVTIERFRVGEEAGPTWTALEKLEQRRRMQLTTTVRIKGSDTPFGNQRRLRGFRVHPSWMLANGAGSGRQILSTFRYLIGVTA